jgi:o-succinylbenzoate synthase
MQAEHRSLTLVFKNPAGTSRGVMQTRITHFLILKDGSITGIGECAPLPGLSADDVPHYSEVLQTFCRQINSGVHPESLLKEYSEFPSLIFGVETALAQIKAAGDFRLFDTPFSRGEAGIPINGLIWMGSREEMHSRAQQKIADGFTCLKFKVGALDFDTEWQLLQSIRAARPEVEIRLDANGGFAPEAALSKLEQLATLGIHSIEQPIMPGQYKALSFLCRESPIPIALDEELIRHTTSAAKRSLLERVKPAYLILKPSLHGGFSGCDTWISAAEEMDVKWWLTSALESNIGLNAIAQYAALKEVRLPQGLGTGGLFVDNFDAPLALEQQHLYYKNSPWNLSLISNK